MRAMLLRHCGLIETNPLKLEEIPTPEPKANEILVHVHCCAICRTDLHVIEGELPTQTLPIIPGHQIIGTVEKLGSEVTSFKIGQRVGVAWLRSVCGFAEHAVVRTDFAYSIPESLCDIQAAPLMCAGIIGYRAQRGGTLALAGIHMSDVPTLNYEKHLFYEKSACSVTANTREDGIELLKAATDALAGITNAQG